MKRTRVPARLRALVAEESRYRCGYCQTQAIFIGARLLVDHLVPVAAGGKTERDNLWLACFPCNAFKGRKTEALDPETGQTVPLFNPRTQSWHQHFVWSADGTLIIGQTPTGRATVVALKLNHDDIVRSRRRWAAVGWHPPQD